MRRFDIVEKCRKHCNVNHCNGCNNLPLLHLRQYQPCIILAFGAQWIADNIFFGFIHESARYWVIPSQPSKLSKQVVGVDIVRPCYRQSLVDVRRRLAICEEKFLDAAQFYDCVYSVSTKRFKGVCIILEKTRFQQDTKNTLLMMITATAASNSHFKPCRTRSYQMLYVAKSQSILLKRMMRKDEFDLKKNRTHRLYARATTLRGARHECYVL